MSHFVTLVFTKENGKSIDELLEPFDENIYYEPYIKYTKEEAINKVRKDIEEYKNGIYARYLADPKAYEEKCRSFEHLNYLKNEFPKRLTWTDNECYEYMKNFYNENLIDENGNLLSIYNPNSKWDWYETGGRWDGYLKTLSGEYTNEDYVNEIDWTDIIPFAFVTSDGEWHEKGEMGWFATVSNEKNENGWEEEFQNYINNLDENTIVTVVDCHI